MKNKSKQRLYDETRYYRAKYWNPNHPEAGHVYEVFSGRNIMEARDYAKSLSTPTKQLFDLQEYEVPGDAMTY